MDAENYCFDFHNYLAVMKGAGLHQNAIFCMLYIFKNLLKADFLLVFGRGNVAKYLVSKPLLF